MYFVASGGDVTLSLVGPAAFAFVDVSDDGGGRLCSLTPGFLVASGMTFVPSLTGPADAILVDDGSGGITTSTDLSLPPIADTLFDTAGVAWSVRRTSKRWSAVRVLGDVRFY